MRVIYVTSSLPHGKKEAFIIPEIRELKRRGHEVLIVPTYPRGKVLHGDVKPLMSDVVSKPLLSADIARVAVRQFAAKPTRASRILNCLFRSRSAGVLLRNLVVYPKGLWLADLARDWRADHVHAHWATVPATMALIAGEVSGLPWSITAHRFDIAEDNLLDTKAKRACFIRAINRRGAREIADRISPEASPPSVIHMGVALPPAKDGKPRRSNGRVPRVVVPANLLEVKGHTYLLEAVRLLKDRGVHVHVDLAGDGPLREKLMSKVEELELRDRIAFLGLVPHEKLLESMQMGDWSMLVLPSIVTNSGEKEGIPVAIIEAMSCRVPVVSTMTGGIPELFEGVDDALLMPPNDPAALAEAIERLIKDPSLRERLIESGHRRVEEGFAAEQVAVELTKRFQICGRRRR
ncbi:MAG: glycosyltransferase family 4 protein [Rubrobacter sp.]|nr:glycosyltransferase family 4 protein [Rubrobacter sp.]